MPVRPRTPLTLAVLLVLAACGDVERGLGAYREGRFGDARAHFAAAAKGGADVPAEVHYDHALAALRDDALDEANAAAERALANADPRFRGDCAFLLGSVRYARAELAGVQAATAEAEPFAYDVAISLAGRARDAWRAAAASRDDWPAARRNAERAQRLADDLARRKRDAADGRASAKEPGRTKPAPAPAPRPAPIPPPPDANAEGGTAGDSPREEDAPRELTAAEVRVLLDLLARKEEEKLAARRAHREARSAGVDRDW